MTSNKIFFDPCKTHPLVMEHGCEEYLLSCSVDNLASVSFFSDISHVHFTTSLQRSAPIHYFISHQTRRLELHGKLTRPLFPLTFNLRKKEKNIFQKRKNAKSRSGNLPDHKVAEPAPSPVSAAPLNLPSLTLSLTKEVSEDEESESRDMAEVERELESGPGGGSEVPSGGLDVLSSAASFCCGAQEPTSKVTTEPRDAKSQTKSMSHSCLIKGYLSV